MANTRITQGVIKPNEDYIVRNISASGIITATELDVDGVLTYEDVTSVDSIGIITARKGIVSLGVVTATAFHGDGSQLTGIDATALKDSGGNVKIQAQASGAVHTGFSTMQNLRVTGIATFGTSSTVINGDQNTINVGTALTLGHTQGLQFHTQNLHSAGFEINQINASGIITAAQFSGDGSNLANLPAGLGTALSSTQSSPLNKMYYTNQVLGVPSSITVDVPASSSRAYTQYADIKVESSADLIIAEGDDLIPDVLGLADFGTFGGGPSAGRMRVNTITNAAANGAPTVSNGLIISGVTTTSDIKVGTGATLNVYGEAIFSGIVTATTGMFSNLSVFDNNSGTLKLKRSNTTGEEAHIGYFSSGLHIETRENTNIELKSNTQIKLLINPAGAVVTGILTATSFGGSLKITDGTAFVNKHSVGVGTTTTAGRNAGVSTAIGTLNFNTTLGKLEFYNGNKWVQITDSFFSVSGGTESTFGNYSLFTFTSNGTFTVTGSGDIDILVVAGGGQGGLPAGNSNYGGGGGAGGLVWYTGFKAEAGEHSIVVGNGGAQTSSGSGNRQGNDGSNSTAFGLTALGGGGGGGQGGEDKGRPGGAGGGGGYADNGGAATQPSQSNSLSSGTLVHNLGNAGAAGNNSPNGGGGGGGAGGTGFSGGSSVRGGAGFNASSLVGTAVGDSGWFAGGGGGSQQAGYSNFEGNNGGNGGGGDGDTYNSGNQTAGQSNTGGGGGAGTSAGGGKAGGSGVVIIRVLTSLL